MKTRKEGRGHIYIPVLQKNEYEAKSVKHMVDKVFDGAPIALVKQLLDTSSISEKDLQELKKLLSQHGGKK